VKSKKHVFSHKPTLSTAASPTSGAKPENPGSNTRERALDTASTISSSDSDREGDEANVDDPSEEAEKNRVREEEFASLAHQFEGRKEAINDIMVKLDDLFNVLSEFHSLQAPSLDFPASRHQSPARTSKGPQTESRV